MLKNFSKIVFLIFLLFGALPPARAATPSVEAEVDRHSVSVDDTLTLIVTVHGGGTMSSPDIPSQGHFDVVGRSMNTAVEIINGEMSMTKSFEFTLAPRSAGDFSIGPIKVYMEGQEFSAPPVTVHVTPSRANNG